MFTTLGIDIGATKTDLALIDSEGRITDRKKIATPVEIGAEAAISQIVREAAKLSSSQKPLAAGIGIAGQIYEGVLKRAPNLNWTEVPITQIFSQQLQMPVETTNDVRAALLGEWTYGAGKGYANVVCIFIGTGIGGAVLVNNALMEGSTGCAGELGHMTLDLNGPRCSCGNAGCLEALASGWALAKQARESIRQNPLAGTAIFESAGENMDRVTTYAILDAYRMDDPTAHLLINNALSAICAGCVNIIHAFNPECLILGGGLGLALPNLIEQATQYVQTFALKASSPHLRICKAQLGNDAGVIGAGVLARQLI
jgi:glucokinase